MKLKIKKIAMVCLMILSMMLLTLSPVFAVGEEGCVHPVLVLTGYDLELDSEGGPCILEVYQTLTCYYYCTFCGENVTIGPTRSYYNTIGEHSLIQTSAIMVCENIDCDYWEWAKK